MAKKHCANCKCYEKCPTCGSEVPEDQIKKPAEVVKWYPYSPYVYPWWQTTAGSAVQYGTYSSGSSAALLSSATS